MSQQKISREEIERVLRASRDLDAPEWLSSRIMTEVSAQAPGRRRPRVGYSRIRGFSRRAVAACMVLVIGCCLSFWAGTLYNSGSGEELALTGLEFPEPESVKDADTSYLLGRGLLDAGREDLALAYFSNAARLDPSMAEYAYWTGLAYWRMGNKEQERESYVRGLQQYPEYLPAILNLGHSFLENGEYEKAVEQYDQVLAFDFRNERALYNRALACKLQGERLAAEKGFLQYLDIYRSGKWAERAVKHLYVMDNFRFRTFRIGFYNVILDAEAILFDAGGRRNEELARIAGIAKRSKDWEIHLVVYSENDLAQARHLAVDLKKSLIDIAGDAAMDIKASWFDVPQKLAAKNGENRTLAESVLIFTREKEERDGRSST